VKGSGLHAGVAPVPWFDVAPGERGTDLVAERPESQPETRKRVMHAFAWVDEGCQESDDFRTELCGMGGDCPGEGH
jgi:hypothetical protein